MLGEVGSCDGAEASCGVVVEGDVVDGDAEFDFGGASVDVLAAGAGGACGGEAECVVVDEDAWGEPAVVAGVGLVGWWFWVWHGWAGRSG